jgi:predicted phosphate transport protein (TIGR00153 family)
MREKAVADWKTTDENVPVMLKWFRALLPREDRFFDLFAQHSRVVVEAANSLKALLAGEGDIDRHCTRIIELENDADEITRQVLLAVRRSFITPFDRGDIKDLIQSMDDAIDMMHKTVKTIRLFEQSSFDPGMRDMGVLIVEAAGLIAEAIPLLNRVGTHSARLSAIAEEVVRVEERADELYDQGLKDLFQRHGKSNPMAYIIGSEIYGELEKVVDRFEDVADEISGIVIENV